MCHKTAHKPICFVPNILVVRIKNVSSIFIYRNIHMHSRTRHTFLRFWHKSGMKSKTSCNRTDCTSECNYRICTDKCLCLTKINFLLTWCAFVMRRFYLKSHLFQSQNHITPWIFPEIKRSDRHIACHFMCKGSRNRIFIGMEEKKFAFRIHIKFIPFFFCFIQYIL